jgi:ribosome biogenesis GTPase
LNIDDSVEFRLEAFGWSPFFRSSFEALGDASLVPARVSEEHRSGFVVVSASGDLCADVAGRLRHAAAGREELPAVGDWVAVDARLAESAATIHHVLPRRGALVRKAAGTRTEAQVVAANLDVVFVMTSADADFSAARLARYLTVVWESGAEPVVLLTKADLADDADGLVADAARAAPGAAVHAVSAVDGRGLDALAAHLAPGRTAALIGSSGVGKSTLANRLLGEERLAVSSVREHDDTGRHTTTFRQLVALPGGALVIDTPGMRELGLWDSGGGLDAAFRDVADFAVSCRFRDCRHAAEPGCAVLAAVGDGSLPRARFEQWQALGRELAFLERKQDVRAMLEERRRRTALGKAGRERMRMKRGELSG